MAAALVKRAGEVRVYTMSFALMPEIVAGATLASVTSVVGTAENPTDATALTISGKAVTNSTSAHATISAGQDGAYYRVEYTVVLSTGITLVGVGYMAVDDG